MQASTSPISIISFGEWQKRIGIEIPPAREPPATVCIDDASVPPPLAIGIAELFQRLMPFGNTELYGGMVETEGLLRDINRRQTTTQLLVGEGDSNLQVEIPWALEDALPADLVQGATVKVRGILTYTSIENYEEGIFGRIENIELIPMSPSAVEVVRRAPFFTAERLLFVLAWVLALLGALFVWTLTLRRMVSKRSAELAESIRLRETATTFPRARTRAARSWTR